MLLTLGLTSCVPLEFVFVVFLGMINYNIMLNPLKHLKGKLNHIKLPQVQLMRVYETANAIQGSGSSLSEDESVSTEDILGLRSGEGRIEERRFHRF